MNNSNPKCFGDMSSYLKNLF